MAEIKHEKGIFYIGDKNNPEAELTYKTKDEQTIIANHTFVSVKLRGEGIAGQLFNELIMYARKKELKIIPECSYIQKKMQKTTEYDDVLKK